MADKHAQSIEEISPLIDFCRQGRLEEARLWAEAGRPLDPPLNGRRNSRRVPLLISIDKEFFSLAALLIQHGAEGLGYVHALEYAINRDRAEIVKLLLDSRRLHRGAVDFSTVCSHGNAEIVKIFIEHGADLLEGLPIYQALANNPLAMARLCKELLHSHPEIQAQLDMALLHHADEASGKVIGLLLWAGAQPHVRIKGARDPDDEMGECAIEVAVRRGDVSILKQMHPDRHPNLVPRLSGALFRNNIQMLDYLLSLGLVVNDKPNGGSSLADRVFWGLWFPRSDAARDLPEWILFLGSKGAKWIPDEARSLADARRHFYKAPSDLAFAVIKALLTSGVCKPDQVNELIKTPKMHDVLGGGRLQGIDLLLNPPKSTPPAPVTAGRPTKRRSRTPIFVLEDAEPKARTWLLDQLCEEPRIRFWTPCVTSQIMRGEMCRLLGIGDDSKRDPVPFFERAVRWAQKHLKRVTVQRSSDRASFGLDIQLAADAEWKEAIQEAQSFKERTTPYGLTSAASKLLVWTGDPNTAQTPIREVSLSHKLGMIGRLGHIDDLIHEIEAKAGLQIVGQTDGSRWQRGGATYQFSGPKKPELPAGDCLDLQFGADSLAKETRNLRRCRRQIEEAVLMAKPTSESLVYIFRAGTMAALRRAFPSFEKRPRFDRGLGEFFSKLKLPHALKLYYDFRSDAPIWYAAVKPANTWEEALREIQESTDQPSPSTLWGVGESASVLLQGLLEERTAEHPKRWIVKLSKELCIEMGLGSELLERNFSTWIAIFAEEISEMTPCRVTVYPWKEGWNEELCLHCRYMESP